MFACRGPLTAFLWAPNAWVFLFLLGSAWSRKRYRTRRSSLAVGDPEQDYSSRTATVKSRATVVPNTSGGQGHSSTSTAFDSSFLETLTTSKPLPEGFSKHWDTVTEADARKDVGPETKPSLHVQVIGPSPQVEVELNFRTNHAKGVHLPTPIVWFEALDLTSRTHTMDRREAQTFGYPTISAIGGPTFLSPISGVDKEEWVLWDTKNDPEKKDAEYRFSDATTFAIISAAQKQAIYDNAGSSTLYEVEDVATDEIPAGANEHTPSSGGGGHSGSSPKGQAEQSTAPSSKSGGRQAAEAPKGFSNSWAGLTERGAREQVGGDTKPSLQLNLLPHVKFVVTLLVSDGTEEGAVWFELPKWGTLVVSREITDGQNPVIEPFTGKTKLMAPIGTSAEPDWVLWDSDWLRSVETMPQFAQAEGFFVISAAQQRALCAMADASDARFEIKEVAPFLPDGSHNLGAPPGFSRAWDIMPKRPELPDEGRPSLKLNLHSGAPLLLPGPNKSDKSGASAVSFWVPEKGTAEKRGAHQYPWCPTMSSSVIFMAQIQRDDLHTPTKAGAGCGQHDAVEPEWVVWTPPPTTATVDAEAPRFSTEGSSGIIISAAQMRAVLEHAGAMSGDAQSPVTEIGSGEPGFSGAATGSGGQSSPSSSQPPPSPPTLAGSASSENRDTHPSESGSRASGSPSGPPPGSSQRSDSHIEKRPEVEAGTQLKWRRNNNARENRLVVLLSQRAVANSGKLSSSGRENELPINSEGITTTANTVTVAKIVGEAEKWLLWTEGGEDQEKPDFYIISSEQKNAIHGTIVYLDCWTKVEMQKEGPQLSSSSSLSSPPPSSPPSSAGSSSGGARAGPPSAGAAEAPNAGTTERTSVGAAAKSLKGFSKTWGGDAMEKPRVEVEVEELVRTRGEHNAQLLSRADLDRSGPIYTAAQRTEHDRGEKKFFIYVDDPTRPLSMTGATTIRMAKIAKSCTTGAGNGEEVNEWLLWDAHKPEFHIISSDHRECILRNTKPWKKVAIQQGTSSGPQSSSPPSLSSSSSPRQQQGPDPKPQQEPGKAGLWRKWEISPRPPTLEGNKYAHEELRWVRSYSQNGRLGKREPLPGKFGYYRGTRPPIKITLFRDMELTLDTRDENPMMLAPLQIDDTHRREDFEPEWALWKRGADPNRPAQFSEADVFYIISAEHMKAVRYRVDRRYTDAAKHRYALDQILHFSHTVSSEDSARSIAQAKNDGSSSATSREPQGPSTDNEWAKPDPPKYSSDGPPPGPGVRPGTASPRRPPWPQQEEEHHGRSFAGRADPGAGGGPQRPTTASGGERSGEPSTSRQTTRGPDNGPSAAKTPEAPSGRRRRHNYPGAPGSSREAASGQTSGGTASGHHSGGGGTATGPPSGGGETASGQRTGGEGNASGQRSGGNPSDKRSGGGGNASGQPSGGGGNASDKRSGGGGNASGQRRGGKASGSETSGSSAGSAEQQKGNGSAALGPPPCELESVNTPDKRQIKLDGIPKDACDNFKNVLEGLRKAEGEDQRRKLFKHALLRYHPDKQSNQETIAWTTPLFRFLIDECKPPDKK
ncbi:unnamed protein product [Amoebophrya sp. A25]|nr:unnamed protein product [Amoebophrya sp. A25]|eukprot:GSA25T00018724001.1